MLTRNRIKDSDNVVYGKDEELIPTLSGYLQIPDLGEKIRLFRESPVKEGVTLRGARRTSALMFIPDLYFDDDLVMGGNVWLYLGDLQPAYCIYVPWEETEKPD
ncbi:MAG: hypothetical protein IJJ86_02160 [Clostridia bacterium]|nr:hypothetical protein [Clostridia bacterium]